MTMIQRPFWQNCLVEAWKEVPIVWLSGVRRVGKTTLAESLGVDHVTCLRSKNGLATLDQAPKLPYSLRVC